MQPCLALLVVGRPEIRRTVLVAYKQEPVRANLALATQSVRSRRASESRAGEAASDMEIALRTRRSRKCPQPAFVMGLHNLALNGPKVRLLEPSERALFSTCLGSFQLQGNVSDALLRAIHLRALALRWTSCATEDTNLREMRV